MNLSISSDIIEFRLRGRLLFYQDESRDNCCVPLNELLTG